MLKIIIHEKACRGCQECIDICLTDVFAFDEQTRETKVVNIEDCIACLSCAFVCPARAITHTDYHVVKNFYRDSEFYQTMGKYL